jgi:hypothetical protein
MILFLVLKKPLEDKSHIFAPPCNILYISMNMEIILNAKMI